MTATTTSSRYPQTPGARPAGTPAARPPPPHSVGQAMPPLLAPRTARSPPAASGGRTPSPNYFGFAAIDESYDSESAKVARKNWSPPSSAVRSTAAFSPTVVPVDQNPDFDAFRRQSEGKAFNLGNLHTFKQASPARPSHGRNTSRQSNEGAKAASEARHLADAPPPPRPTFVNTLDPDSAYLGRSPKRALSNDPANFTEGARRASPASFLQGDSSKTSSNRSASPERHPRSSLPLDFKHPLGLPKFRAETLPLSPDGDSSFATPQYLVNLLESHAEEILILDLRVSTQYAASRISGALNLCIPTTLLKRPSFNVKKLAETFKDSPEQKAKFEGWKSSKYIIVYDSTSSQLKDATTCVNTVKKFDGEGYDGTTYILKGGFADFSRKFPQYIESSSQATTSKSPLKLKLDGPEVAPVIGGCPMPATQNAANPFFGNIRQNMDLIGGVGQMPVKRPASMSKIDEGHLPEWLRHASDETDKGARVSDKFLHIEKREQKRMQDALSGNVSYGTPSKDSPGGVQIAGIEKGSKNRYNNIWPFEHTRVKLENVPNHGCDYVNANYITSKRSNKRYIATQGPIPATFTDFWNVVWQQDIRVIVMLTAEKEGGQIKAHNYWHSNQHGPMRLEFLSEKRASLDPEVIKRHRKRPSMGGRRSTDGTTVARPDPKSSSDASSNEQPYVIVRKLALSHEGHPFQRMREVTQLQYSSWPDFGAPAHPAHLLGLVEQCDAVVRRTTSTSHNEPDPPEARPILVHCSAGCGRTGTFCTVDTVIDMLKRQRQSRRSARQGSPMELDNHRRSVMMKDASSFFADAAPPDADEDMDGPWLMKDDYDLIEKTVENFRHQRISMVQSLRQFVLCYETVMEWLVEQDKDH
ncbi:hypothetical protein MBLNU459_g7900t1 [Dothideomycetes sp. NU459]